MIFSISAVAADESAASLPIDSATTENPLPYCPARAASMDAFNASSSVWEEISSIVFRIPEIFWDCASSAAIFV